MRDGLTESRRLVWTSADLRQMAEWRMTTLYKESSKTVVSAVFESSRVLDQLLGASGNNPQRYVRLWNACLRRAGGPKIGDADLNAALAQA